MKHTIKQKGGKKPLLFPYLQNLLVCACVPEYHGVSGCHSHHSVVGQTTNVEDLVLAPNN